VNFDNIIRRDAQKPSISWARSSFRRTPRGLRHDDARLHPAVTLRRALARRRHARRLARRPKALPKEQKPEFTELVTEAMTAANKMG